MGDEDLGIVISSFKDNDVDVVRMERKRRINCPPPIDCQLAVQNGLYSGVFVAKPGKLSVKVKKAHVRTEFITHLTNFDNTCKKNVQEKRSLLFWLLNSNMEDEEKLNICSEFMHHLLELETFPLDKVGYIKKVLWLLKQFDEMRRVELNFEPVKEVVPEKEEVPLIENYITVLTPSFYDYQYLPEVPASKRTKVQFKVKSGGAASVALGHVYGDTDRQTYEIVLGDNANKKSLIRYGGRGEIVAESRTPNILNAQEFTSFWIDWSGGAVQVGKGEIFGENVFLIWKNIPLQRKHQINLISVSGSLSSTAQWEFIEFIKPYTVFNESRGARRKKKKVPTATLR